MVGKGISLLWVAAVCLYVCSCSAIPLATEPELVAPTYAEATEPELKLTATMAPLEIPTNTLELIPLFSDYEKKFVEIHKSADGRWTVTEFSLSRTIDDRDYIYSGIEVTDHFGSHARRILEIVQQNYIGISQPEFVGFGPTENTVYLVNLLSGDGCFALAYQDLISFNLLTGKSTQLGPNYFREFAISPNGNYLAYIPINEDVVVSLSLLNGEETRVAEDFIAESSLENSLWMLSGLVWLPDSSSFVFSADRDACSDGDSTVIQANPFTGQIEVLYDFQGEHVHTVAWLEEGILVSMNNGRWILDPTSGVLTPFE
jgi:hypothetical protein